jgi:23S rRNA (cytosine1962-C5)-methyltransferase
MLLAEGWKEYTLLDCGEGEKLEKWGKYILRRPDPQAIWPKIKDNKLWENVDAIYSRSNKGGGKWEFKNKIPSKWNLKCDNLNFYVQPTGFKHTGLFPEQYVNWKWIIEKIKKSKRKIKVLNLFGYTGAASVAAAYANADVCHVDAAKAMVLRAKENLILSNLNDRHVRFITDDVMKFVQREIRRKNKYDAIIMDPPSYGRGPKGEVWKIEDELFDLVKSTLKVLSENPLFFIINSYTTGLSPCVINNIMQLTVKNSYKGIIETKEIGIPIKDTNLILPCGSTGRWEKSE